MDHRGLDLSFDVFRFVRVSGVGAASHTKAFVVATGGKRLDLPVAVDLVPSHGYFMVGEGQDLPTGGGAAVKFHGIRIAGFLGGRALQIQPFVPAFFGGEERLRVGNSN